LLKNKTLVRNIIGLKAWKAWLDSNMHICLLAVVYSLILQAHGQHAIGGIFAILGALALYLAYMVLINDYFDMPYDKLSGKDRTIYHLPKLMVCGLTIATIFLGYIITIVFVKQLVFLVIYTIAFLFATFYSAPPIRFKERGFLGVLCDAVMEKPLPVILIFSYFDYFTFDAWFFIVLCFIIQVEVIIHHQILDYEADLMTQIKTFVIKISSASASLILNAYLRPLVALFILFFSVIALVKIPYLSFAFGALIFWFFVTKRLIKKGVLKQSDEQYPLYFNFLSFYFVSTLPLYLTLLLALRFPPYSFLVPLVTISQFHQFKYYIKPIRSLVMLRSHPSSFANH